MAVKGSKLTIWTTVQTGSYKWTEAFVDIHNTESFQVNMRGQQSVRLVTHRTGLVKAPAFSMIARLMGLSSGGGGGGVENGPLKTSGTDVG